MNDVRMIVVAVALVLSGAAVAQAKSTPTKWDETAAKEALAAVDRGLAAVEKMDIAAVRVECAEEITAFDIDMESKPVRMTSLGECMKYMETIVTEAKKMGMTVKFENRTSECHAIGRMAYCTTVYDFVATAGDGTRMSQPSQTTVVLRKGDDGWKWVHWHTSLSAQPTAAPAGK